jgi:hypothetical protein
MDDCPAWHLGSYGYSVCGIPVQGLPMAAAMWCVTNLADQPWPVRHADYLFERQIKLISDDFLCYPHVFGLWHFVVHFRAWPANQRNGIPRTA